MLAAALVVPALPLVVSAPAHAATNIICVNRPSDAECQVRPGDIATALQVAAADNADSIIRLGPGTYTGPFTFDGTGSPLTIQGNGNGTGDQATVFTVAPGGGSPVLTATATTVRNVRVQLAGSSGQGVRATAGSTLQQVIVADTPQAVATNATAFSVSDSLVQESTVNLDRGTGNRGMFVTGTVAQPAAIRRVTVRASDAGITAVSGPVSIENSLLELGPAAVSGLQAGIGSPQSQLAVDLDARYLTIVGGVAGSRLVEARSDAAAVPSTVTLVNSIVRGPGTSLVAQVPDGTTGVATINVSYTNFATKQALGGTITEGAGNLNVDPAFRNPGASDYQLRVGSPVVDKGNPLITSGTDRNGDLRAVDGDGNGSQVPDMGAFELNDITAPTSTFTSGPSGPTNNRQPVFQFRSNENGARLECALDGGAFQPCTSPATTPPLADGSHSFSVRSTDAAFNVENPPVTRTFTVDTVAPNATITKKPAKRFYKKRVKFKFAVDEPGATLQCNLDGKGWKKCNAVWKFNTKVGKHVMLVRAVDAAGNVDATPARYKYKRLPQKKRR